MNKIVVLLFFVVCVFYEGSAFSIHLLDSVGVTTKGGENYIIHEVEAGETLFALSRKYGIHVQNIKDANSEEINNLSIGQKVLIPVPKILDGEGGSIHVVKSSETLFSISRQYNVQVDDLKKWNDLTENSISIGEKLVIKSGAAESGRSISNNTAVEPSNRKTHIVEQSQTLYSISKLYGVSTDLLKEWNSLTDNALNIGQVLIVSSSDASPVTESASNSSMLPTSDNANMEEADLKTDKSEKQGESVVAGTTATLGSSMDKSEEDYAEKPAEKVMQRGIAEVIENRSETKKYLALHRDAPIGTIMQVRNEMNNQSVFVRIVGTIPATGDNSKVILKISKKAYDRLGAVDDRFPVELSYIP